MRLPKGTIDKFFLEQYIVENWDYISELIASKLYVKDNEMEVEIYLELKKYKLSYATLTKRDEEWKKSCQKIFDNSLIKKRNAQKRAIFIITQKEDKTRND